MLNTTRSLLGALVLKPELVQALGDFDAKGLFSQNESTAFLAISDLWEDGHPDEINPAILTDRLRGKIKDPGTFVGSLLAGLPKSALTPEGVRACVRELRRRRAGIDIIHETDKLRDTFLAKGEPDKEGLDTLIGHILEYDGLQRENEDHTPNLIWLNKVNPEPVTWLWPGRLPKGKITLLSGDPGAGKSFLALDIAARITSGRPAPDGKQLEAGPCLFLIGEDGLADTVRNRADMLKADPSKIIVLDGVLNKNGEQKFFRFDEHMAVLEKAARKIPELRLIVIDPIASFLGKFDANKQGDARAVMDPLARLAENYCVSVLVLAHLNKAQTSSAVYRTSGSQQWPAAARAVFYLAEDPDDRDRRVLDTLKMNLAKKPHKLSFTIADKGPEDYRIDEDDNRSADEILQPTIGMGNARALQQAVSWLRGELGNGPKPQTEIKEDAHETGIAWATLRRAKENLGIDSYPAGDGFPKKWYWMLPVKADKVAQDEHLSNIEQL
jgi:KaiC/GvpD/RAD55 family RecA-like ATPase